jgi:hypothetical protein
MPISRFPRYGFRIAPTSLREVLEVPLPRHFHCGTSAEGLKLCDLDEQAWKQFSPETCVRLAKFLVETVRRAIPLPINIDRRPVPSPPEGMTLEELQLEQRTYNCLRRLLLEGQLASVADLGKKEIGELLGVGSFGAKCLVDLLTSLEATQTLAYKQDSQPKHENSRQVREEDGSLRLLFTRIRQLRLPKLPEGIKLTDLSLAARTYNCFERQGYLDRPHDLEELSVEEALEIPGFGMQSLMDYLGAIDRFYAASIEGAGRCDSAAEGPVPLSLLLSGVHLFLEDELEALVSGQLKHRAGIRVERNAKIVSAYLGLDGSGGATLRQIGEKFAITRERVRQIYNKAARGLKRLETVPPLLQRTLEFVSQHLPIDAAKLEAQLEQEGLTRKPFRLEGLANAIRLLNRAPPFEIEEIDGCRLVVHPDRVRVLRRTITLARKAVARFGVTTIADVAARVARSGKTEVSMEFVAGMLEGRPEFEWLDQVAGWFWIRSLKANRIINRLRKILCVTQMIEIGELRSGIARHHAMNGYAPPRRVLLDLK